MLLNKSFNFLKIICLLPIIYSDYLYSADSKYIGGYNQNAKTVIIFVHGVLGDSRTSWTNETTKEYWPELITKDPDFKDSNVYVFDYRTLPLARSLTIPMVAREMKDQLERSHVLNHPRIIFLAHSMGGLVVREFLINSENVVNKIDFIYFFATPTNGSPEALITSYLSRNPQFGNMRPLQSDNYLAILQTNWLDRRFNIKSFCAFEGKKLRFGLFNYRKIVNQASALSLCTEPATLIQENHFNIVKPSISLKKNETNAYYAFKEAFELTKPVFITDLNENLISSDHKPHGDIQKDRVYWNYKNNSIYINNKHFKRGLLLHPNGPTSDVYLSPDGEVGVFYDLKPRKNNFKRFKATIGLAEPECEPIDGNSGSVEFILKTDDYEGFSRTIKYGKTYPVDEYVGDVERLELITNNNRDGNRCDSAVWANARLVR